MLSILNKDGILNDKDGILDEINFSDFKDIIKNKSIISKFKLSIKKNIRETRY